MDRSTKIIHNVRAAWAWKVRASSRSRSGDASVVPIRRGVVRLAGRLRAERPPGALPGNKIIVLAHLYRFGPSSPGTIASASGQLPQSLTRTFADLQLAGMIDRRPSTTDRRESILTITDRGSAELRADMAQRDTWLSLALETLSDTEVELLRLAAVLMDRLSEVEVEVGPGETELRGAG